MSAPPDASTRLPRKRRLAMLRRLLRAAAGRRVPGTVPPLRAADLPPLRGRTEIVRDARGVSHVYAEHERDAWAVVGYLQGADRFFQIDLIRHLGAGRLCEWIGNWRAPRKTELFSGRRVADVDAFLAPLELEAASERDWQETDGAAREVLAAFAEGVNAALRAMRGVYPAEYLAVGRVRPWEPWDALVAARASGFTVSLINLDNELTFHAVREQAGDALARQLYPDAPWAQAPKVERRETPFPEAPVHMPSAGSNNWAVGPGRSASGAPILANDPHVPLVPLPTYWMHLHLEYEDVRVQGGAFPGFPGFGFGHNGHLAWGCTTAFRDGWDLVRIHRLPGDPTRYRTPGGSGRIERRQALRTTRSGRAVELSWERCAHGVLYPDWKDGDGVDLALRQVPCHAGRYVAGGLALARARTLEEHTRALELLNEGPFDFNHVWAHRDGAFGWQVFGRLPRRRADGLFVRDAHDPDAQWEGFLPLSEMPHRTSPAEGYVASANSVVDPDQADRVATPVHYEPRYRQERIERWLAGRERHDVDSFHALQADVESEYGPPLRDALVALLEPGAAGGTPEAEAVAALREWPGDFPTDSRGAPLYFFVMKALCARVYRGLLGERLGARFAQGRRALPRMHRLLLDSTDPLRAEVEHTLGTPWADVALAALRDALAQLAERFGPERSRRWGAIQRARLGTLLAEIPRLGERLVALDAPFPGDDYTVSPARSLDEGHRLRAFVGASSRFVCDLSRPEEAWFAHSSGPSGDPGSALHASLCLDWVRFRSFRSALWPADEVPDVIERVACPGRSPAGSPRPPTG